MERSTSWRQVLKRRQLEEEEMIGMERRPVTYASVRGKMTWMEVTDG